MISCAYCNNKINLTKEHIFPSFVYKKLNLKNNSVEYLTFDDNSGLVKKKKELFIKKVCKKCNNEKLSRLDSNFENIINKLFENSNNIENFDYQLTIKWLLKTFFNTHLYINQKSKIEIYKNKYTKKILNNIEIKNSLLFTLSLNSYRQYENFMSIGTILKPVKVIKYIDIYNFFQVKNNMFIVIVFKKDKYYKKHSKEIVKYLKQEYNAYYCNKNIKSLFFPTSKLPIEYIYNSNEENTSIPFKTLCKLQWNLNNKIPSIKSNILKILNDPIETLLFMGKYDNRSNSIYTSDKEILVSTSSISFLLSYQGTSELTYCKYDICRYSYNEVEKIKEYENANIEIKRYDNLTEIRMDDLEDKSDPFIKSLNITQTKEHWNRLIRNIKCNENFIFLAISKSKAIEKEIENGNLSNIIFISKVKVIFVGQKNE